MKKTLLGLSALLTGMIARMNRDLNALLERDGVTNLNEVIGREA